MKKDLWLKLRNYHFEHLVPEHMLDHVLEKFGGRDASTKAFAHKIAKKHVWTTRFALRAIDEYRKFVYLGVTGDGQVTPPDAIDRVWHEHVLFSRAYREFCRDILGRDFDHHPELVARLDQTQVFADQYQSTLARYVAEFNVIPPQSIWGRPKFDVSLVPRPSGRVLGSTMVPGGDETPLFMLFDTGASGSVDASFPEFGGGGGFSGGGGGASWTDAPGADSSDGGSGADSASSDAGSGDSGSSCSSSSCSSSCSSS